MALDIKSTWPQAPNIRAAIEALDTLTEDERTEVFYYFCTACGKKENRKTNDRCWCQADD